MARHHQGDGPASSPGCVCMGTKQCAVVKEEACDTPSASGRSRGGRRGGPDVQGRRSADAVGSVRALFLRQEPKKKRRWISKSSNDAANSGHDETRRWTRAKPPAFARNQIKQKKSALGPFRWAGLGARSTVHVGERSRVDRCRCGGLDHHAHLTYARAHARVRAHACKEMAHASAAHLVCPFRARLCIDMHIDMCLDMRIDMCTHTV